jgi:hypothetical protein
VAITETMKALRPRRWPAWLFRILTTLSAVLLFNQAVFAGQFLSGSYIALELHKNAANVAAASVLLTFIAALLLRLVGRGPWWPILSQGLFILAIVAQISLGYARVLFVHVPLGVATILAMTIVTLWSWRRRA